MSYAMSDVAMTASLRLLMSALPGSQPAPAVRAAEPNSVSRRDPETWRRLYEDSREALYRYAISRLGDGEEAEDLVGEVFEAAWKHAGKYRDEGLPARAWLFGIARNLVRARRRSLLRRPPALSLQLFDVAFAEGGIDATRLDLARAISRLPASLAEVVTLRFLHDLTAEETARTLGISVASVKGRQVRAFTKLRKWMAPEPSGAMLGQPDTAGGK